MIESLRGVLSDQEPFAAPLHFQATLRLRSTQRRQTVVLQLYMCVRYRGARKQDTKIFFNGILVCVFTLPSYQRNAFANLFWRRSTGASRTAPRLPHWSSLFPIDRVGKYSNCLYSTIIGVPADTKFLVRTGLQHWAPT